MSVPLADFVKAYDVRGLVPAQLNPDVARALGAAFVERLVIPEGAGAVVIGHDMRPSSPELVDAFAEGVVGAGADVVVIGLCSTDGLYHASGSLDLPGAMFTASHNPARYNGIKLCRSGARPVGKGSGLVEVRDRAQTLLDAGGPIPVASPGSVRHRDMLPEYTAFLRGLVDLGGSRPLRVTIDAGNGMGGLTAPAVLGDGAGLPALPLTLDPLYFELDGTFPHHEANPLDPKNLLDLQERVVASGSDIGLAFDGDADRCFVVDERGAPVSPSAITAMIAGREIAREVAAGTPAQDVTIVHNPIVSAVVPETVAERGARAVRARTGHSWVKEVMGREQAVFGGEHSAHYYFRDFWFADTGMLAAMHVLAALGEQEGPLSSLMAPFERYVASGEINSAVADTEEVIERVRDRHVGPGARAEHFDGLTVCHPGDEDSPMWWFNLRASNTEPLLRLNVEAADVATMEQLRDDVLTTIRED
ncbi:phosphomannomutase/phosphoglucomutase [Janibacter corallicola]|uniref:phosphomannomutase/phosphoglucomutase n=1 Tax=Janibacter corallicola TaxID=415212 RepID=UPI00082E2BEA|nr:phosphomannomutase/phosphoglucomutase [Janibacter corallicola]